jgi:hypothetical protein
MSIPPLRMGRKMFIKTHLLPLSEQESPVLFDLYEC